MQFIQDEINRLLMLRQANLVQKLRLTALPRKTRLQQRYFISSDFGDQCAPLDTKHVLDTSTKLTLCPLVSLISEVQLLMMISILKSAIQVPILIDDMLL